MTTAWRAEFELHDVLAAPQDPGGRVEDQTLKRGRSTRLGRRGR